VPTAPTSSLSETAAPDTAQRVLREQVAMLYATSLSSTITGTLLACALSGIFYWRLHDPWALAWLGLNFALLLRRPLYAAYYRDPEAAQRSQFWATRHYRLIAVYSAVWGLAPWFFMPQDDLAMTSLMMLVMLGLASGGVPAVGARWPSLLCFVLPMVSGLIAALVWRGSGLYLALAALTAIHLAATLDFARQQYRMLITALTSRFEKEALAEQLTRQSDLIQRASDEKSRFFAAASHDLRQPLHAIALFGAVLEKDLQGQPQHTNATRLMRAVNVLGMSLDTMLDVSRLDAGVIEPELQPVALNTVFQAVNQVFASVADAKGLQLRLRASPLWVQTDPQLLQRLLSNLVDNAIKYSPQGGVLVVARARGASVWIDVVDTGIGIAPDQLDPIFNEFYQVNNPGRDRAQGLGIGLSIVRRLSDLLRHPVQVYSRPGRGSRFRILLPSAPAQPPSGATATTLSALPQTHSAPLDLPRHVLLIDDEADIGDAMTALLTSHGIRLHAVHDETQAAAAFGIAAREGTGFDAMLCDYRLANGADGLDAALRLRQRFNPDLPVLLITGETAPARLQRVRELGVPVLFKPVAAEALLAALAKIQLTQT
jgi:signal transduction histidine kinase/ActR/RegA family two-component response regulator